MLKVVLDAPDGGCGWEDASCLSSRRNVAHEMGRFPRHCEEPLRRSNPSSPVRRAVLLTWGMCVSRMSSHLFVLLRPPLRPDRGLCRMTRADQVKAGPLGPPRSGLALS